MASPKKIGFSSVSLFKSKLLDWEMPEARRFMFLTLVVFCASGLIYRSLHLQVLNRKFLQAQGDARHKRTLLLPSLRGKILDRNGEVLAESTPAKSIWVSPEEALDIPDQFLTELAGKLNLKPEYIRSKIDRSKNFFYLKRSIPSSESKEIAALKLPGIHEHADFMREYPAGESAASVVGFTNIEGGGQEGIELISESTLTGTDGKRTVIKNRRGEIVQEAGEIILPQHGLDVTLTLDKRLQDIAHEALRVAVQKHEAIGGGAVILDARTGEILALANMSKDMPDTLRPSLSFRNRVVTDVYEPGSTMKPFIAAMALEAGKMRPETTINCAPGYINIGGHNITDSHPNGVLTLAGVIQKSSNVCSTKIALSFDREHMWTMLDAIGIGHKPGTGFPAEARGRLRDARTWKPIEQATMSFGHGLSTSLMQIASAYSVLAHEGIANAPTLIKGSIEESPEKPRRVFSAKTAKEVLAMLEMVTLPGGTATTAQVPGYRVGGKTGTARKLSGGRYITKYVSSFVGIAPINDPKIVVAVMIDEPSVGGYYGGVVAGPAFSSITGSSLQVLGVPQDAAWLEKQNNSPKSADLSTP